VTIKSIHAKRVNVKKVVAGQSASFALKKERRANLRKGMVMVADENPDATWEFLAEVLVLYHSTTIQSNYQPVIHTMCVRQCAKIIDIEKKESLRTGDKALVKFRFMFKPEYIKIGERLIFREGRTKGLGVITKVVTTVENKKKKNDNSKITEKEVKNEKNFEKDESPSILDTNFN
jgi:GTPase